ncbi:hypothetical protein [Ancylobacter pratisalsi]|uniref:Uncharacterized protein n=1 Tax=Ancylobacter pratisalsi TaxID=1745854 RepID=A0A6P1YNV4_9HYPH|nr:hypothetical protein [Ancylobacter pratisalsi]QIB34825.1 hypothetical protein G3A50_14725 [Ancylobacter pratisalsi]
MQGNKTRQGGRTLRTAAAAVAFSTTAMLASPPDAAAAQSRSYEDHNYAKDCGKEREQMMSSAANYAFNWCKSRGGLDKQKTVLFFVIDKGEKLPKSFKTHFCQVKGEIYCH